MVPFCLRHCVVCRAGACDHLQHCPAVAAPQGAAQPVSPGQTDHDMPQRWVALPALAYGLFLIVSLAITAAASEATKSWSQCLGFEAASASPLLALRMLWVTAGADTALGCADKAWRAAMQALDDRMTVSHWPSCGYSECQRERGDTVSASC